MSQVKGSLNFDEMVEEATANPENRRNAKDTIYKLGDVELGGVELGKIDSYDIDTLKFTFDRNIQENVSKPTYWVNKNEDGKLVISITGTPITASPLEADTPFEIVTPAVTGGKKRRRKTAKNARKTNKRMKKRKSNRRR